MEVVRRGACVIENEDPPFGRWWEKEDAVLMKLVYPIEGKTEGNGESLIDGLNFYFRTRLSLCRWKGSSLRSKFFLRIFVFFRNAFILSVCSLLVC